jgi:uncharacterized protein YydD (DUF2326 family)
MIHTVFSDLPSFKNLDLHPGLNVLEAVKTSSANATQTRNDAGKTSFVELIHFVLGYTRDNLIFYDEEIKSNYFGMGFDLGGALINAKRTAENPKQIFIEGDFSKWPAQPEVDEDSGLAILNTDEWLLVLADLVFGLDKEEVKIPYGPTFRALFPYFARRIREGNFQAAEKYYPQTPDDSVFIYISCLLGINWKIPCRILKIKKDIEKLNEMRKASIPALRNIIGEGKNPKTTLKRLEKRVNSLRRQLDTFKVIDEYEARETEASRLTIQINSLINDNTADKELIEQLKEATETEAPPPVDEIRKIYEEASLLFPDIVNKRFEELEAFHKSVVRNRQRYLQQEINAAEARVNERNTEKGKLSSRRASLMEILKSGGALQEYTQLQDDFVKERSEVEVIKKHLEIIDVTNTKIRELKLEDARLHLELGIDLDENSELIDNATQMFEDLASRLYDGSATIVIDTDNSGPKIAVRSNEIIGEGSREKLIFCFDMTLMAVLSAQRRGPGFLIHDSHLFDAMDVRQTALSLKIGAELADEYGFQYIVTLNSDRIDNEDFLSNFGEIRDYSLPVKLTDETETGGLFGMRL